MVLPIKRGVKETTYPKWTAENLAITVNAFGDDDNIALRLGGRTDIDCDPEETRQAVVLIASAALFARHWPSGSRHVATGAVAGFLVTRGISADLIERVVRAIVKLTKDEEEKDRLTFARDTIAKFKAGGKTTGGPTLEGLFGKDVVAKLYEWFAVKKDEQPSNRELRLVSADSIEVKATKWLWMDRMPIGSLGLLAGREGIGKAQRGHVVGGKVFGYRNVDVARGQDASGRPIRAYVDLEIHEPEAAVIGRLPTATSTARA